MIWMFRAIEMEDLLVILGILLKLLRTKTPEV